MSALALAALVGLSWPGAAGSAQPPSRAPVSAIVAALRADPDLKDTRSTKVLRWKQTKPEEPLEQPGASWFTRWLRWVGDAFDWIAEAARWLMWLLGALLVALTVASLRRWSRERADPGQAIRPALPSRVGALDVGPQSLPDRIGSEAQALWLRGQRRAALSLLYRGALSRLIHVYAVPILTAHTEAECLRLAQGRLEPGQIAFFARLVGIWQLAVYAARDPEPADVLSMCDEFDRFLAGSSPPRSAS